MLTINQTGNTPIILTFDSLDDLADVSIALYGVGGVELKAWNINTVTAEDNTLTLNLTEEETRAMPAGKALLTCKFFNGSGEVTHFEKLPVMIAYQPDKSVFVGEVD